MVCHSTPASSKSLSFDQTGRFKSSASASTSTSSGSRLLMRRLRQAVFVGGTLRNGDWKGRQREQQGIQMKVLLPGKRIDVLEDLIEGGSRREDLLDLFVPEHQGRASADDR